MQTNSEDVKVSTACVTSAGDTVTLFRRGNVYISIWDDGEAGIGLKPILQGDHLPNHVNLDDLIACLSEARKFMAEERERRGDARFFYA